MKFLKYIIINTLLLLNFYAYSQTPEPQQGKFFELSGDYTGDSHYYKARDYIELTNFVFEATENNSFIAEIDPNIIVDADYDQPQTPFSTALPVGSINCNIEVSPNGASIASIPVIIPNGIMGMQPTLNIIYNSQGSNGTMGMGWNISGFSVISRTPTTLYHNNILDPVDFDNNDQFSIDGQRLIYSGTENSKHKYFTEIANFDKILAVNKGTNNDPDYFILKSKDGKTIYYGNTSDSRIESKSSNNSDKALFWLISKIQDNNGNYIEYEYLEKNGTFYPKEIKYTGNSDQQPYNSVKFYYVNRKDKSMGYIGDGVINQKLILYKIVTTRNDQIINTYEFKYNYSDNYYSQLSEIVFYNNKNQYYNTTKIEWGNESPANIFNRYDNLEASFIRGDINIPCDYNGDGKTDLICIDNTNNNIYFWASIGCTTDMFEYTGSIVNEKKIFNAVPGDFNGDGFADLIVISKENPLKYKKYKYWFYKNTEGVITKHFLFDSKDKDINVGDFDGNGKTDFINKPDDKIILYKIHNESTLWVLKTIEISGLKETYLGDFNGDGKTDVMAISKDAPYCRIFDINGEYYSSNKFTKDDYIKTGDFNGDGKSDVLWWFENKWKIAFFTGSTFTDGYYAFLPFEDNDPSDKKNGIFVNDYNGDGKQDVLLYTKNADGSNSKTDVRISLFKNSNFTNVIYSKSWDKVKPIENNFLTANDFNGDGKIDILAWMYEEIGGGFIHNFTIFQNNTNPRLNLVQSITNGFNIETKIEYEPLTNSDIYTKNKTKTGDVTTYQIPLYVVSKLQKPNGIGGWFENNYYYENFKIHREGKGVLGFDKFIVKDVTKNFTYETIFEYNTTYFNTSVEKSIIKQGNNILSETTFNNSIKWNNGLRIYPITSSQVFEDKKTNVTQTSEFEFDDYGNISSTRNYFDDGSEVLKEYTYTNEGSWCNYLVKTEKITKKRAQQQNYVRKTKYNYYSNGNLHQIINDEDYENFKITKTYSNYNNFGQAKKIEIQDKNKIKTIKYNYDDYGRMISSINPLNQTTTFVYDDFTDQKISETDFNNLTVRYEYDNFGKLIKEIYPDYTSISYETHWNTNSNFSNSVFYNKQINIDGTHSIVHYDKVGREIYNIEKAFDGRNIISKVIYNSKGQKYKVYEPYYQGESANLFVKYTYDAFGRVIEVNSPTNIIKNIYTDAQLKTETKILDKDGSFIRNTITYKDNSGLTVQKHDNGGDIFYEYFASGLLKSTSYLDSEISLNYDLQGNKIKIDDPDAGIITYTYDAFGNLTSQTNANGQTTFMNYDIMDRLTLKSTPEGDFSYTYNQQGRLEKINNLNTGYNKIFYYDDLGRNYKTTENIDDQSFSFTYTYDNIGRVNTIEYPGGFKISKNYNNFGYLNEIRRADNNQIIWQLNDMNEFGQITQTSIGNIGKITNYGYDEYHYPTSVNCQGVVNREYTFDISTGNLTDRYDNKNNINEHFEYDNLDRLTDISYNGNNQKNIDYYLNGNIKNVTGLGNYHYNHPTKIHAVTQVDNSNNSMPLYEYDVEYTSFNSPKSITKDQNNTYEITYGADQSRKKTVLNNSGQNVNTKYYCGAYEKEITPQGTRELNYITSPDGIVAIFERHSDGTNRHSERSEESLYYIHKDYLGSIIAVSDQNGNLLQDYYYSAWGKRQILNNNSSFDSFIFDRGYTGHQHLAFSLLGGNEGGLINMNARLYDPELGRMLSPDNFVQNISNTQNFNRYSYVLNNPLKYTDPSGNIISFTKFGYDFWKTVSPIAFKIDLPFGTHSNGIGLEMSVGIPYSMAPIGYRYNLGATYYLNRVGGYGSGWQVRNGGEWSLGFGTIRYGGTRYRDYDNNGNLLVDQVNHTISIGRGRWRISYTNDSFGSFPWTNNGSFFGLPNLEQVPIEETNPNGSITRGNWNSDRYRTASGNLRVGIFELGFFLHTGEGDGVNTIRTIRQFVGGNIDDPQRSNGIIYFSYFDFKIGRDSEHIRQVLQNDLVHDRINGGINGSAYPWVMTTSRDPQFVFQFGDF